MNEKKTIIQRIFHTRKTFLILSVTGCFMAVYASVSMIPQSYVCGLAAMAWAEWIMGGNGEWRV